MSIFPSARRPQLFASKPLTNNNPNNNAVDLHLCAVSQLESMRKSNKNHSQQQNSKTSRARVPFGSTEKLKRVQKSIESNQNPSNEIFINHKLHQQNPIVRIDTIGAADQSQVLLLSELLNRGEHSLNQKHGSPAKNMHIAAFKSTTERFKDNNQSTNGSSNPTNNLNTQTDTIPAHSSHSISFSSTVSFAKRGLMDSQAPRSDITCPIPFLKPIKQPLATTIPSMPIDQLGFKQLEGDQLEKVKPAENGSACPGSYQIATQPLTQRGLEWKKPKEQRLIASNSLYAEQTPSPFSYEPKQFDKTKSKSVSSCFKSTGTRFDTHKDKVGQPGPGYYDPALQSPKKTHHYASQSHFYSNSARFEGPKGGIGPGQYFQDRMKLVQTVRVIRRNQRENSSLATSQVVGTSLNGSRLAAKGSLGNLHSKDTNVKSSKKTSIRPISIYQGLQDTPGPGAYVDMSSMDMELKKDLLRKHSKSVFGLQKRTIFGMEVGAAPNDANAEESVPGPGSYNSPKIPDLSRGVTFYKQVKVINLKDYDEQTHPNPTNYNPVQHTIAFKADKSANRLRLTEPKPFESASDRFKHYNETKIVQQPQTEDSLNQEKSSKVKKIIMTNVKVCVPFGSFGAKYAKPEETFEGDYNTSGSLIKSSHNCKTKG